jgi:p-aminobenzoyl-glutamate transporter AbgT
VKVKCSIILDTVKVESNLKIIFIKKTMVQGMIQSKTLKSSTDNSESMADEMRKYLKYL